MTKTEASAHEHALPVTHGWPGSVIEQLKIIGLPTNPLLDFMQLGGSVCRLDLLQINPPKPVQFLRPSPDR